MLNFMSTCDIIAIAEMHITKIAYYKYASPKGRKGTKWRSTTILNATMVVCSWVAPVQTPHGELISSACSRILFLISILRFLSGLLRMQHAKTHASRSLVLMCSSSLAMHLAPILASKYAKRLIAPLKGWSSLPSVHCLPIRSRASAKSKKLWFPRAAACAKAWRRSPRLSIRRTNPKYTPNTIASYWELSFLFIKFKFLPFLYFWLIF